MEKRAVAKSPQFRYNRPVEHQNSQMRQLLPFIILAFTPMGLFDRFLKKNLSSEGSLEPEQPSPEVVRQRREEWQEAISAHFQQERATKALPSRELMSKAEHAQRQIIGSSIHAWLKEDGPRLLMEREAFRGPFDIWDSEPVIVVVASIPGLVAASEILSANPKRTFYFTVNAFKTFLQQNPDPDFLLHVTYDSQMFEVPLEGPEAKTWKDHPLAPHERYWIHAESYTLGPLNGQGWEHLWKWDGEQPVLLKQSVSHWVS